jgi:hypothetical protein
MRFIKDALYRLIGTEARLTSHTFGSVIASQRHMVPAGTLLAYRGTIHIGYDSVDEDVFETVPSSVGGGTVRGTFFPSSWGLADFTVLAPLVPATIGTSSAQYPANDLGPLLDLLPDEVVSGVDGDFDLINLFSATDLLSCVQVRGVRRSRTIAIAVDISKLDAYKVWRKRCADLQLSYATRIAVSIVRGGGLAVPHPKYAGHFKAGEECLRSSELKAAVALGAVTLTPNGALAPTEYGRAIATTKLRSQALSAAQQVASSPTPPKRDERYGGYRFPNYHRISEETVQAARDHDYLAEADGTLSLTDAGRAAVAAAAPTIGDVE